MSWYDRDYAQPGSPFRRTTIRGRGGWLIHGSIVTTLIVINVVVYVLAVVSPTAQRLFYGLGELRGDRVMEGQVWRLITTQYLHGGTWHLVFNMLALHFLGRSLEQIWSARRFFTVYTVCGLAGSLFYVALVARGVILASTAAVGASGSIYGLIGIVAVMFPQATVYIYFLFPVRMRTCALILGGIAFLSVLERTRNFGGEACHLAGLVFGVWWAMKGDQWWSTTEWRVPRRAKRSSPFGARPSSPPPSPRPFSDAPAPSDSEVDRILRKVYERGIHSLTDAEKNTLMNATERQRDRSTSANR